MMNQVSFDKLVADSGTAFAGGNYEIALQFAKQAIDVSSDKPDGYYAAGKACMSMENAGDAITYFKKALKIDKRNGNGYFLLGYSQAMAGDTADSLRSMTRALENNCDETLKGQIYKIMSMINTEQEDYDDALRNLKQAEDYIGVDIELLQQRAGCYAAQKNYREAIFTLNQMKLLQPKDYKAYSLAFSIFMDLNLFEEAKAELERAEKFADLTMSYYNDRLSYAFLSDPEDTSGARYTRTLSVLDEALKNGKPTVDEVFELYLRAAQTYVSLEAPEQAIACLDAAVTPVESFNSGFSVMLHNSASADPASDSTLSPEEEEELMQERWDNGEFEELSERIEEALYDLEGEDPEYITEEIRKCLTPVDGLPASEAAAPEAYKLHDVFVMTDVQRDLLNGLYLSAYELQNDYDKMLEMAAELQSSAYTANRYLGIYYELRIGKLKGAENWQKKYRDRLNFWTKRMLEDPTDYVSASYRIRCYIDLGDFENAELLCSCLPPEVKDELSEEIRKAKAQGDGENGNSPE